MHKSNGILCSIKKVLDAKFVVKMYYNVQRCAVHERRFFANTVTHFLEIIASPVNSEICMHSHHCTGDATAKKAQNNQKKFKSDFSCDKVQAWLERVVREAIFAAHTGKKTFSTNCIV